MGAWFLKESYSDIAGETGVERFHITGKLYFFGGILSLVMIGFALIFVAAAFEILAFLSLPESAGIREE